MSRRTRAASHSTALRDPAQRELFEQAADRQGAGAGPARLARPALIERLARGGDGRPTVLTPNLRLAQALVAQVDALHIAERRSHWEAPDVIAYEPFLRRCHDEALYSPRGAEVPSLLADAAARILWEEAIRASRWRDALLSVPATAALASEAWALAHAWRIEGALRGEPGSDDAEAFATWAEHYARRTARDGLTDLARLPAVVAPFLREAAFPRPATLVLYAFDLLTPQQADFVASCELGGIAIERCDPPACDRAQVTRTSAGSPRAELELAARWARARLEAARPGEAPRIAVVVPDLAQRRREAARVFSRVLHPSGAPADRAPLFNVSLGEALSRYPIVDAALAIIELPAGAVEFDRVSRLIRSPFLGGAEAELSDRARLDAALRRVSPAALTLNRLCGLASELARAGRAPRCGGLSRLLDGLVEASRDRDRAPAYEWARRFTRLLDRAGFPGERTLDSAEHQALEKWRQALRDFAALGGLGPAWSEGEARSRLRRLCAETIFQPRSGEAPVQVLGLLESVGLEMDHLWVSGLTEEAWPIAARPHPLIPPALQRRAGIPQASPEEAFKVDARITRGWKAAAKEVVLSHARADGDRELPPSPLIADVAAVEPAALGIPEYALRHEALFAAGRGAVSRSVDDAGPAVAAAAAHGGTGILVDQAACPFRAFAHHRLGARGLEAPEPALDAADRGTLLHAMMAAIWERLKDHATLCATSPGALRELVAQAVDEAVRVVHGRRPGRLEGRFAELERERLAAIAMEWLEIEKARAPFEVRMREEKIRLTAGRLMIDGRVDRIDRLLKGGGIAVIDYKTGRAAVAAWMGERPDDAQLPLYALAAAGEDVRAVAFARLKTGDRGFSGVARDPDALPGVAVVGRKYAPSWEALVAMWRREVDALGEGFAAGDARVDPKEMLATCRRCDLKALCRVHERLTPLDEGDEIVDAAEEEGE